MTTPTHSSITNDDSGDSEGHAAVRLNALAVSAAIGALRPQRSYYGPFNFSLPRPHPGCVLSTAMTKGKCGRVRCKTMMWHRWWETWEKIRRSFSLVVEHEQEHGFRYGWMVRLRPDLWFFGTVRSHCELSLGGNGMIIPAGVTGCFCGAGFGAFTNRTSRGTLIERRDTGLCPRCQNDHLAFVPRGLAHEYFELSLDIERCNQTGSSAGLITPFEKFNDGGGRYLHERATLRALPLAPSPAVPYTLLRNSACHGTGRELVGAPDCYLWRFAAAGGTGWPQVAADVMRTMYQMCMREWKEVQRAQPSASCPATTTMRPVHGRQMQYFFGAVA